MRRHKKRLKKLLFIWLVSVGLIISGFAQVVAQGVAQGYFSDDDNLKPGMVVQISDVNNDDTTRVERGANDDPTKIIGLATGPDDSFVVIASGDQEVYVQTSGEAGALVSDVNGEVKKGDQLTISPLKGILMKAGGSGGINFGTALEDFPELTAQEYKIDGGTSGISTALVAKMRINLDGRSFANNQAQAESTLAKIGESLVGRNVGEARVLIALLIFLIVLVAEGGIIYGAISSAITALGRNPLASKVIKRELLRVLAIAFIVLSIGLAAIYGVLWL